MSVQLVTDDPARTSAFKVVLVGQAAAALVFGLAPLLLTALYAATLGFTGADPLVYRLGGAATTGYAVVALYALVRGAMWNELRIPSLATLTFSIGAFGASLWEVVAGTRQPVVVFVVVAGAVFALIAAWFVLRDRRPIERTGPTLTAIERLIIALSTVSAGVFGVLPLLAPAIFAPLFGLAGTDTWVFRLAGAGTLGYAIGGIAALRTGTYGPLRIQNLAAITFNALGAAAAWVSLLGRDGGWLAPVVAIAATFFAVTLSIIATRRAGEVS
jgi:hypothetical protein